MPFEIVTVKHKGLLFKIVIVEHKGLPSKIVIVEHKGLGIIFFLLVFLNLRKLILNCKTNSGKIMVMTWQLMWLILSIATLNATFKLLVIYILYVFLHSFLLIHISKKIQTTLLEQHYQMGLYYIKDILLFLKDIVMLVGNIIR